MPVDRITFDADQAQETADLANLVTLMLAFINNPAVIDFSAEDATLQAQRTAIANAVAQIPPPQPGPAKPAA